MFQLEFDLSAAEKARDAGMIIVAANSGSWFDAALASVAKLPVGWTGLGEDIRDFIQRSEVGPPPTKPNVWGSLIREAKRRKLIERTGVWRPMRADGSHARETPEYKRTMV